MLWYTRMNVAADVQTSTVGLFFTSRWRLGGESHTELGMRCVRQMARAVARRFGATVGLELSAEPEQY